MLTLLRTDQSSQRHELVDNGGFANFKLLLVIQNTRDVVQILEALVTRYALLVHQNSQ